MGHNPKTPNIIHNCRLGNCIKLGQSFGLWQKNYTNVKSTFFCSLGSWWRMGDIFWCGEWNHKWNKFRYNWFNYLPIRCWFCLEPSHRIKECLFFIALKGKNMKTSKLGKGEHVYRNNPSIGNDTKTRWKEMTSSKKIRKFHDDPNREKVEGGDLQRHGKSQKGWEKWTTNGGGKIYNNDKQEKKQGQRRSKTLANSKTNSWLIRKINISTQWG